MKRLQIYFWVLDDSNISNIGIFDASTFNKSIFSITSSSNINILGTNFFITYILEKHISNTGIIDKNISVISNSSITIFDISMTNISTFDTNQSYF